MKALLVHNPYSRRALSKKEIDIIINKMSVDYTTDIFSPDGEGTIEKYVKENGQNYNLIIACGGDGTIHEVALGILSLDKKPKLAIIPRGTMNDVARCYKMPKNLEKCVEIIRRGNSEFRCAYKINDTYFLYGLGIGRFASVSYKAGKKRELGKLAYYLSCIKDFFKSKPTILTIDNKKIKVSQVFIFNNKYLAGYPVLCENDSLVHLKYIPSKNRFIDTIRFFLFLISKSPSRYFFKPW